jgi:cytochrome c-type biogenesis protein CcmH/NrfG
MKTSAWKESRKGLSACGMTKRSSLQNSLGALLLSCLLLSACASSHQAAGNRALEEKDYARAVTELRAAIKQDPSNTPAIRDLGITLCEMKNYSKAELILQEALRRDPSDGLTRWYLGETYEQSGKLDEAIAVYRDYPKAKEAGAREQLRGRLDFAIQAQLQEQARQALANERNLDPKTFPENSVAVLNFQQLGGASEFAPLSRGLADMVITDLSQVRALTVVERSHAGVDERNGTGAKRLGGGSNSAAHRSVAGRENGLTRQLSRTQRQRDKIGRESHQREHAAIACGGERKRRIGEFFSHGKKFGVSRFAANEHSAHAGGRASDTPHSHGKSAGLLGLLPRPAGARSR